MAAASPPQFARDWRLVALIGCVSFPASFALYRYAVPLGAWAGGAGELPVSVPRRRPDGRGGDADRRHRRRPAPASRQHAHAGRHQQHVAGTVHVRPQRAAGRVQPPLHGSVPTPRRGREAGPHARQPARIPRHQRQLLARSRPIPARAGRRHGAWRDHHRGSQIHHRPRGLRHQPADAGRRLGGDPRGHHRTARGRARTRRDARTAAAPRPHRARDRGVPPARRGSLAHGGRRRHGHALDRHRPVRQFRPDLAARGQRGVRLQRGERERGNRGGRRR